MKTKTPNLGVGASRNSCGGISCDTFTLSAYRAQHLASRYALSFETAAVLAALAFGGARHG